MNIILSSSSIIIIQVAENKDSVNTRIFIVLPRFHVGEKFNSFFE